MPLGVDAHPVLLNNRSYATIHQFDQLPTGATTTFGQASLVLNVRDGQPVVEVSTANIVNNFAGIRTTNKNILQATNTPGSVATRVDFVSSNGADKVFVAFGTASTATLPFPTTTAGVGATSFSGAMLYKNQDENVWRFVVSNGTTKTEYTGVSPLAGAGTYDLTINWRNYDSSNFEVYPQVDGKPVLDANNQPIKGKVAYASLLSQYAMVGDGAGGGGVEKIGVHYLAVSQLRSGY